VSTEPAAGQSASPLGRCAEKALEFGLRIGVDTGARFPACVDALAEIGEDTGFDELKRLIYTCSQRRREAILFHLLGNALERKEPSQKRFLLEALQDRDTRIASTVSKIVQKERYFLDSNFPYFLASDHIERDDDISKLRQLLQNLVHMPPAD
jgi:hypothetical protein